jgi:hypothetical protein
MKKKIFGRKAFPRSEGKGGALSKFDLKRFLPVGKIVTTKAKGKINSGTSRKISDFSQEGNTGFPSSDFGVFRE